MSLLSAAQFPKCCQTVCVKPAHCGEGFGVSLLQLLDQGLHVGRDYFFRGPLPVGVGGGLVDGCGSW